MSPQPLTLTPHQQRPWRPATVSTLVAHGRGREAHLRDAGRP